MKKCFKHSIEKLCLEKMYKTASITRSGIRSGGCKRAVNCKIKNEQKRTAKQNCQQCVKLLSQIFKSVVSKNPVATSPSTTR